MPSVASSPRTRSTPAPMGSASTSRVDPRSAIVWASAAAKTVAPGTARPTDDADGHPGRGTSVADVGEQLHQPGLRLRQPGDGLGAHPEGIAEERVTDRRAAEHEHPWTSRRAGRRQRARRSPHRRGPRALRSTSAGRGQGRAPPRAAHPPRRSAVARRRRATGRTRRGVGPWPAWGLPCPDARQASTKARGRDDELWTDGCLTAPVDAKRPISWAHSRRCLHCRT